MALQTVNPTLFFSSRRRHTRLSRDWSSDVCSSDLCNHLNIVLASDAARREIVSAAGDRADATMARLAADFAAEPGRWPVLGFFGDACLFDTALEDRKSVV